MLVVSRAAQAIHAHAERCRAPPVCGSRDRWSGTVFGDLWSLPQIYTGPDRHSFVILRPFAEFKSLRQGAEIFTPAVTEHCEL